MRVQVPLWRSTAADERGNVLMTFGLTSFIAMAAVGGAVDFGRAYQQKSKMQNALDAAVVSGVSKMRETGDWNAAQAHAMAVFKAVYPNATQGSVPTGVDAPVVTFSQGSGTSGSSSSSGSGAMSGVAFLRSNTPFLKLITGQDLRVGGTSSAAPPSGRMLEVALMVDVTGSMGWNAAAGSTSTSCNVVSNPSKKIDYLKCAGEDLLNILLPSNGAYDTSVKIGVAPFADFVNAGPYAAAVTGLASSGGSYQPITNLASTKQGTFSGTFSGSTANGNGWGATGASVPAGGTSTAGQTFSNNYCSSPTQTTTGLTALRTKDGYRVGVEIDRADDEYSSNFNPNQTIAGVITLGNSAPSNQGFKRIIDIDGEGPDWIDVQSSADTKGYFVPLPVSTAGLTARTRTAWASGANRTGIIGASVAVEQSFNETNLLSWGFKKATSNSTGYWRLKQITDPEGPQYEWKTSGWYIPLYESLSVTTTTTVAGCEGTNTTASSQLISCVTERVNGTSLDYTASPITALNRIGPYNTGAPSKSNYSSDGKCWVAGRVLPQVIPLTNDRATLSSFFAAATVGGATPGHLGTAWANYLLSPEWSDIWPTTPAAYTDPKVSKAAILMTDGEYNLQFSVGGSSTNTSAKQALMLCKEMRAKGIKVYTIGFGFAAGATPPSTNIEAMSDTERTTPLTGGGYTAQQKALDTLAKCASSNSSYYFPYDGEALRTVFRNIANSLSSDLNGGNARITQ